MGTRLLSFYLHRETASSESILNKNGNANLREDPYGQNHYIGCRTQ